MEETALADRLQEKIAGVCLIVGVLLMPLTTFFEYSKTTLFPAGVIGLLVYALFVPGFLGITHLLRQPAPRLSVVAGMLTTLGCIGGVTFETALLHEWAARTAGTPDAMVAAIMERTDARVFPVLVIFGILFPISLLTLSIGLFRTGAVPAWVAILLGIGAILHPVGHIGSIQSVTHVSESFLLIPLVWIGLRFLTGAAPRGHAVPATA